VSSQVADALSHAKMQHKAVCLLLIEPNQGAAAATHAFSTALVAQSVMATILLVPAARESLFVRAAAFA
jgi:hypothetical protein